MPCEPGEGVAVWIVWMSPECAWRALSVPLGEAFITPRPLLHAITNHTARGFDIQVRYRERAPSRVQLRELVQHEAIPSRRMLATGSAHLCRPTRPCLTRPAPRTDLAGGPPARCAADCCVREWHAGWDSNPQPAVLETAALPIELPTYKWWQRQDSNLRSPCWAAVLQTAGLSLFPTLPKRNCACPVGSRKNQYRQRKGEVIMWALLHARRGVSTTQHASGALACASWRPTLLRRPRAIRRTTAHVMPGAISQRNRSPAPARRRPPAVSGRAAPRVQARSNAWRRSRAWSAYTSVRKVSSLPRHTGLRRPEQVE